MGFVSWNYRLVLPVIMMTALSIVVRKTPFLIVLSLNVIYCIYIYICMMFKTVPFNMHESNFQSLMMHANYVTVVGFGVTFWDNLCRTICFYCYENCVHVPIVISDVNVYIDSKLLFVILGGSVGVLFCLKCHFYLAALTPWEEFVRVWADL